MSTRRVLPVVRWLQVGTVAAGLGVALAAAPVAWADDDSATASDSVRQSSARSGSAATTSRSTLRNSTGDAAVAADSKSGDTTGRRVNAGPARVSAQTNVSRSSDTIDLTQNQAPAPSASTVPAASATTESPVAAVSAKPKASATANTASAAPGLGYLASKARLNWEDLISGTGKPTVTNPTAVVTGMFLEVLRRNPTETELQNYLNRLNWSGVNGVVAGLYSSQAFRQNVVENYYLELLDRVPTQQELNRGVLRLTLGTEPAFAASIAGDQTFYAYSGSNGGTFGTQPSATTFVDLLNRTLLGKSTPPNSTDPLVTAINAGLSISRAADQFVNTDAYRTVKVEEVYKVLGQAVDQAAVDAYVQSWFRSGGQAGISQSLLATATNVQRIEAGQVAFPDMAAAAVLQTLLLAPYIDGPTGFHAQYKELIGDCSDTKAAACKNPTAYALIKDGGEKERGIPNGAISTFGLPATIATMIPTQNEINLGSSLNYPLQNNATLTSYFVGGLINHPNGPVITANDGTYIIDGHHRWSAIYLINPNAQIVAVDLGYVPTPQTALRESQLGIAATTGTLKTSAAGAPNVYDVTRPVFDLFVSDTIAAGGTPAAIIATFGNYISSPAKWDTYTDEKKMEEIQNYMWNNVLRMRDSNPYIPNAPSRIVMPQFDPTTLPTLQNLDGGRVSYSFPTISYLG